MAGSYPKGSDNVNDLWRRIAGNFVEFAGDQGATGLNPVNFSDSVYDLEKKTAYATAKADDAQP